MIIKKELCANIVGTLVHLGLEIIHFKEAVRGIGVTFGEGCDTNAEPSWVGVLAGFVELTDVPNEIGCVEECVLRPVIVTGIGRRVASESEDIADANGCVPFERGGDFLCGMIDTR